MVIYKHGCLTQDDPEQIQQVAREGLKPGTTGLRVQRADHSAMLPPCFCDSLNRRVLGLRYSSVEPNYLITGN